MTMIICAPGGTICQFLPPWAGCAEFADLELGA
jgi:hypothetical protein